MRVTRADPEIAFRALAALGIAFETHSHPAVFTVAESASVKADVPGAHTKNLFLKDRKGRLFLVVADQETAIDLKRLHGPLGAASRLSFGSADLLRETLGVEPGSVTALAAINDAPPRVTLVIDDRLLAAGRVNCHPLVNTMTTGLAPADLLRFLRSTGHEPVILALPAPADAGGEAAGSGAIASD